MSKASRAAWANHPAIKKALAANSIAQRKKPSARVKAMHRAIDANKNTLSDQALFIADEGPRLELHFPEAKLLSNNTVKRMLDVQLTPYKEGWKKRIADLVYGNLSSIRAWKKHLKYPLICEVLYLTSSPNLMDDDGLHGAFKVVLDGIVTAGIIQDDQKKHVVHIINWTEYSKVRPGLFVALFPAPRSTGYMTDRTLSWRLDANLTDQSGITFPSV